MRNQRWIIFFLFVAVALARADAVLLLEEPYGWEGNFNPMGHAAVYLTGICATSPTRLRHCKAGESGVVISRYHHVAGYDWVAVPLIPYLYAVDSVEEIPQSADSEMVAALRDRYRRAHLMKLAPDDVDGRAPSGDWVQLVGEAYNRNIYGFRIRTSTEQDTALIKWLNNKVNRSHFNLLFNNCANFAASILNFYAPHAVHRNYFADVGIMTPKQVAKSLAHYARRHSDLELSSYEIPQVPGSMRRSRSVKGVTETLMKSKKYLLPLAILNPALTGGIAVVYFVDGRFNPRRNAAVFDPERASAAAHRGYRHRTGDDGDQIEPFGLEHTARISHNILHDEQSRRAMKHEYNKSPAPQRSVPDLPPAAGLPGG